MKRAEGKLSVADFLDLVHELTVDEYSRKPMVVGVLDVHSGYLPPYPVTVYQVSGDDASGVAGLLFPNGDFIEAQPPRDEAEYWEFDETMKYEQVPGEVNEAGLQRVVGNSWRKGEVLWDGSVAGSIVPGTTEDDYSDDENATVTVMRRIWDCSTGGEWATTGELWRALERGTAMCGGPVAGRIHPIAYTQDEGKR